MDSPNLIVELRQNILYLTINRPQSLNALNIPTIVALDEAFDRYQDNPDVYGVILTGSGDKAFAAGADIAEFADFSPKEGRTMSANGHATFNRIEDFPRPVIAAVNGYALGGGCELAMACHIRVASEDARFGQPEVSLGLIPGYGGTQRLVELVGKGRAMELLLTGDMIDADEALKCGLVNHVVPNDRLIHKAEEIIEKIGKKGPLAVARCIELINGKFRPPSNAVDGYRREIDMFGALMATEDFREGTEAFIQKRKAAFKGR